MEWLAAIAIAAGTFVAQVWLGKKTPKELQEQLDAQDKTLADLKFKMDIVQEQAESANRKNARIEAKLSITPFPIEPLTLKGKLPGGK
jgi:uncharacterized protein YoxC